MSRKQSMDSELKFKSADGPLLSGTLSVPQSSRSVPVLMLVGSGRVDRDETVPGVKTYSGKPEKLFTQISDALVQRGFTTFRYDKRGVLDDSGKVDANIWVSATRSNLIADAVAAACALLKTTKSQPKDLIILGHSEGTILAVETALVLGGKVKGLLLLGVQARSMKEMLHYQVVESRSKQESGSDFNGTPEEEFKNALRMLAESKDELAPDGKPLEWYRQHLNAEANEDRMLKVHSPIALFQGEIDPQTPIDEIDRLLKKGVSPVKVFKYPGLGHGFSPDLSGKPTIGPIDSGVLNDIAETAELLSR